MRTPTPAPSAAPGDGANTWVDTKGKAYFGARAVQDAKQAQFPLIAQGSRRETTRRETTRRITDALELAQRFAGQNDAAHKAWVIDQMCRALLGSGYPQWVESGAAAPWPTGTAPAGAHRAP